VTDIVDDDAVARAAAGDLDAFALLVERHRAVALRVAYGIAGDDAEDVVQEACVKAFRALGGGSAAGISPAPAARRSAGPRFDPGRPFRPWLLAIVANEARNRRRGSGRQHRLRLRAAGRRPVESPGPAEATERDADRRRLLAAVTRLSDADREIVALRWFAELSEAETAAALGCPLGTVKSRSSRALGRLRALLDTEERP
jgi:RNA polymerase sigma factor (sigma-70 family)